MGDSCLCWQWQQSGDGEEHLYFPESIGLPIQLCIAVPGLPEHCHLMLLHLAQCFLLREDHNLHPPHLPVAKTEGVWIGSVDAAQFCEVSIVSTILFS